MLNKLDNILEKIFGFLLGILAIIGVLLMGYLIVYQFNLLIPIFNTDYFPVVKQLTLCIPQ